MLLANESVVTKSGALNALTSSCLFRRAAADMVAPSCHWNCMSDWWLSCRVYQHGPAAQQEAGCVCVCVCVCLPHDAPCRLQRKNSEWKSAIHFWWPRCQRYVSRVSGWTWRAIWHLTQSAGRSPKALLVYLEIMSYRSSLSYEQ